MSVRSSSQGRLPERVGPVIRLEALESDEALGLPEVYRGRDERLRRDVLLRPLRWRVGDTVRRAEFLRAATAVSQMDDPRLVQVYDCHPDETDENVDWLVLESVEGRNLEEARLSRSRRLQVAQDVTEVLAELHARGALHGGLDSGGIRLVGSRGQVKILAPGRRPDTEGPPSPVDDMRSFGELLRDLLGEEAGRLETLVVRLTSARHSLRPTAVEAARRLSDERSRPRRLRRRAALWLVAAGLAAWAASFTLSLRTSLADTVAAREDAVRAQAEAEELSSFLVGLFRSAADEPRSDEPTARDLLDRGARRIERDFENRPQVRSRLLLTLGEVYESLGSYVRAQGLLEEALSLRRNDPDTPRGALAEALGALGHVLRYKGNEAEYSQAFEYLEEALALQLDEHGEFHADVGDTLNAMALLARRQRDNKTAEAYYLRSLAIREKVFGPEHRVVAGSLNNLGLLYYYNGRLGDAETMLRRSLAIKDAVLPPNHPNLALGYNNLGNVMADLGRFADAEEQYRRSLEIHEEVSGAMHPDTAPAVSNLGLLYMEMGQLEASEKYLRRSLAIREQAFGQEHAEVALTLMNLAGSLLAQERFDETYQTVTRALAIQRRILDPGHPDIGQSLDRLGSLYLARSQPLRAREATQEAYQIYLAAFGEEHPDTVHARVLLGRCALQLGENRQALELISKAAESYERMGVRGHNLKLALEALADAQDAVGLAEEAAASRERAGELVPES